MRANDARKWLHAVLDLLPLILIPVFIIYSHRHTIDSGFIEVPVNKVVDFNQHLNIEGNNVTFTPTQYDTNKGFYDLVSFSYDQDLTHKYIFKGYFENISSNIEQLSIAYQTLGSTFSNFTTSFVMEVESGTSTNYKFLRIYTNDLLQAHIDYYNFQLFDLTQMFGAGNEPTLQQFNQWYPNDYYDYILSSKQLLKGYSTQTYNDTDIMSQFTYQLYNSVDKYFNMGNVFGMNNVYDWFNLNIFGGNASISIYIVWNIVLYEFVMDLLFLLYGLFMWFIDVMKHIMEKPFRSIK